MNKHLLITAGLLMVAGALSAARPAKPNVVLILADDLGWQDLKCYDVDDPTPYESPNIDALAKQGVLFRQAYSPAPTCAPSRGAIMSGKHPARIQRTHVIGGQPPAPNRSSFERVITPWYSGRLRREEVTIAEALQANGYRTGHSGKWHMVMVHGAEPQAQEQGFDFAVGGRGVQSKMSPHRLTGFATSAAEDPYRLDADGYPKDEVTENAIAFIDESIRSTGSGQDLQPFFLYYATWLVHGPVQSRSKELLEKYCEKLGVDFPTDSNGWTLDGQKNPYYCAMVETFDAYVGKLLDYLETTDDPRWPGHKLIENTYVIVSSDNGGALGSGKEIYTSNAPLDKGKSSAKEGGIRVPLIIAGPGIKEGVESNVIANGLDFYPTILSWTNTEKPQGVVLDGCDLSQMLTTDPTDPARVETASGAVRDRVVQHFPHGGAMQSSLRIGDYKLIYNYDHVGEADSRPAPRPELELYQLYGAGDVRADIEEANNLAASMPEKAQAMKTALFAELEALDASLPYLNPKTDLWLSNKDKVCTPLKAALDGNKVSVSYRENGAKVVKGYLMVTMNGGDQKYEEWFRKEAVVHGDGTLSAQLPEGTTHYLFNLIDENNFLVSYPELDDMSTARKKKKKASSYAISVQH